LLARDENASAGPSLDLERAGIPADVLDALLSEVCASLPPRSRAVLLPLVLHGDAAVPAPALASFNDMVCALNPCLAARALTSAASAAFDAADSSEAGRISLDAAMDALRRCSRWRMLAEQRRPSPLFPTAAVDPGHLLLRRSGTATAGAGAAVGAAASAAATSHIYDSSLLQLLAPLPCCPVAQPDEEALLEAARTSMQCRQGSLSGGVDGAGTPELCVSREAFCEAVLSELSPLRFMAETWMQV
jgi:hypothetical protein